jgi:hypothetical protein
MSLAGAAITAWNRGRSRTLSLASAALVTAGAVSARWSVFKAGRQSAADPSQTVTPQRERVRSGATRGSARMAAR